MLLAQHGADVLKVEPLHGDWGRGMGALYGDHCAHSIAFNRGKRSIALDMKQPEALEIVRKMAAECDVVVEAFRPGVMAKFGLSYNDVKKINPSVVYLSVTGFGPVWAEQYASRHRCSHPSLLRLHDHQPRRSGAFRTGSI